MEAEGMTDKQFSAYVRRIIRSLKDAVRVSKGQGEEAVIREIDSIIAELREDIAN
jgi:hypothetical protein